MLDVFKSVAAVSGGILFVPGCAAMAAAATLICFAESWTGTAHLGCFGLGLLGASWLIWRATPRPLANRLAVNSAAVAVGWVLATLLCAIPFMTIAAWTESPTASLRAFSSPLDAWYESSSSLSSSGLSVAAKSSALPRALQLWRSVLQWIGGVGLAVFALLLMDAAEKGRSVYQSETRSWQPHETPNRTVAIILTLYATMTVLCGASFLLLGMPRWEALNHALIIVSTGGLTVTDGSFTHYHAGIKAAAGAFMWLGAVSFGAIYLLFTGRWKRLLASTPLRSLAFWTAALFTAFASAAWARQTNDQGDSIFNVASAISTCGVSSGDLSKFATTSVWLLIVAMLIGGCSDSTAGGIKIDRAVWMLKTTLWQLRKNLGPDDETPRQWNGKEMPKDDAAQRSERTLVVVFTFFSTLALGFLGLRLAYAEEIASDRVFFQAASALGAVGLSMDLTGPDRPALAKLLEIAMMIAGRLEIIALLLVPPVLLRSVRRAESASQSD